MRITEVDPVVVSVPLKIPVRGVHGTHPSQPGAPDLRPIKPPKVDV